MRMAREHVGEWRVAVDGFTLEDVFREIALTIARTAGTAGGEPSEWEAVEVTARDAATLLVDWANEILGRSEVHSRAYDELRNVLVTQLAGGLAQVSAELRGRSVSQWVSPLKAATYHALSLENLAGAWHAEVLFDV